MRLLPSFLVAAPLLSGCGDGASDRSGAPQTDGGSDSPDDSTMAAAADSEVLALADVSDASASLDSQTCRFAGEATALGTDAAPCTSRPVIACTNVSEQIVTLLDACQGYLFESDIEIEFRDGCATGYHGGAPALDVGCLESTLNAESWSCAVGLACAAWGISTLR